MYGLGGSCQENGCCCRSRLDISHCYATTTTTVSLRVNIIYIYINITRNRKTLIITDIGKSNLRLTGRLKPLCKPLPSIIQYNTSILSARGDLAAWKNEFSGVLSFMLSYGTTEAMDQSSHSQFTLLVYKLSLQIPLRDK